MNILNMKIYIPGKTVFDNLILSIAGPSHIISFLAVQDSSIGDIVSQSVTQSVNQSLNESSFDIDTSRH